MPGVVSGTTATAAQDPFSLTLPPVEQIATILGLYFVVVVPLNFLVLKKLKRGELAWVTAPIISVGFAGFLLNSNSSLYSAGTSTKTTGIVLLSPGVESGLFAGSTQVFIPKAGGYDLKLKDVDNIGALQTPQENYGDDSVSELDAVDTGTEVIVPSMPANNLAFRQVAYRQRVGQSDWFEVKQSADGQRFVRVEVTNRSPFEVANAEIFAGNNVVGIPELKSGQTKEIRLEVLPPAKDGRAVGYFGDIARRGNQLIFAGEMKGLRPGPQIGNEVPGRSSVSVAYTVPFEGTAR
jgi:hypothetical protein